MRALRATDSVLLVAYQCGPGMGSVSQIGWQWFTGMAARREVCLVTHERNRAAIEAAPDRPAGARVIYIDTEWFAGPPQAGLVPSGDRPRYPAGEGRS